MIFVNIQPFISIISIIIYLYIKIKYRKSIYLSLEAKYTHKEMRKFKNDFKNISAYERKNFKTEFELLENEKFPNSLTLIKKIVFPLMVLSVIVGITSVISKDFYISVLNSIIFIAETIFYIVYTIINFFYLKNNIPKLTKHKEKRFSDKYSVKNKKDNDKSSYDLRYMGIIFHAYILRYGLVIFVMIFLFIDDLLDMQFILSAISFILSGIYFLIHVEMRTEAFFCTMQSFHHKKMTPFKHSASQKNRDVKEGRNLAVIEIIMGIIFLIGSFIISEMM